MTALVPSIYASSLVRSDLLKLRKRRSLSVVVGLLSIGAIAITYTVIEMLHVSNAAKHGAAGGIANLGHGTFLIALLGAAAAAIVGSTAGAADLDAGVYRDLVVTGRSRLALFGSRLTGGLAYLLPFIAAAFAAAAVITVALRGNFPAAEYPPDGRHGALGAAQRNCVLPARGRGRVPDRVAVLHDRDRPRLDARAVSDHLVHLLARDRARARPKRGPRTTAPRRCANPSQGPVLHMSVAAAIAVLLWTAAPAARRRRRRDVDRAA